MLLSPRVPESIPTEFSEPGGSSPAARVEQRRRRHEEESNIGSYSVAPYQTASSDPEQQSVAIYDGPPSVEDIPLISPRHVLPDGFRAIFPHAAFNAIQSKCFDVVYRSNDNVVVSAPTGSGKTAIFELAICKLVADHGSENFKVVYQAPTKALCSERARDWEKKFSHLSLQCAELTGDTSQAEMRRVGNATIIITTPEKWDSVTRKWEDHGKLLNMVELFLIDEVHILKDVRGATLEAVVSRMKAIGARIRFVALSATVPNVEDIAIWLGLGPTNQESPARQEIFGEEFRPVKLQKHVYGYGYSGNEWTFDSFLDQKLPDLISTHTEQKPILIFCFTRKSCQSTARNLADAWSKTDQKMWPPPSKRIAVISSELQELVRFGIAFHHAGLDVQDRRSIEENFLSGNLKVICCTSTLAVGINLPCHTVILKGTVCYQDDKLMEYSDLEVMQMLGRAGRPQFDQSATSIILTRSNMKSRYERMVSGQEILESTLHLNLVEHLNSEIGLRTITNVQTAKKWLGSTFLGVRMRRNPSHYHLTESVRQVRNADDRLGEICEENINLLRDTELVTVEQSLICTEYGRAMSKYMVQFATMRKILQVPKGVSMEHMVSISDPATSPYPSPRY